MTDEEVREWLRESDLALERRANTELREELREERKANAALREEVEKYKTAATARLCSGHIGTRGVGCAVCLLDAERKAHAETRAELRGVTASGHDWADRAKRLADALARIAASTGFSLDDLARLSQPVNPHDPPGEVEP